MENTDQYSTPVCPSELYKKKAEIILRNGAEICTTYFGVTRMSGLEPASECATCKYNPNNLGARLNRDIATREDLVLEQKRAARELGAEVADVFATVEKTLSAAK